MNRACGVAVLMVFCFSEMFAEGSFYTYQIVPDFFCSPWRLVLAFSRPIPVARPGADIYSRGTFPGPVCAP